MKNVKEPEFIKLLERFTQEQRDENTWTLEIPSDLEQEEVNSLVWGSSDHIKVALPPMSQIIMNVPIKYTKYIEELSKINQDIHK